MGPTLFISWVRPFSSPFPAGQRVAADALTKLSGTLVPLKAASPDGFQGLTSGPSLQADGIHMVVAPVSGEEPETVDGSRRWEADLLFELEQGLKVGYRGFYFCDTGGRREQ